MVILPLGVRKRGWLDTLIFTVLFEEGVDDMTHSGVVVVEFHTMLLASLAWS